MMPEIKSFCASGLHLVPIPPINGKPTKAPIIKGWNKPRSTKNPGGYSVIAGDFTNCEGFNFGLFHSASNTLALDLDELEQAKVVFQDTANIDLTDWLNAPERFEIKSPKLNRGKLVFKLPAGADTSTMGAKQFKQDGKVIFELRSGNCQDVIYGQHPDGGNYQIIGNPAAIPEIPAILLDMLQHWDSWRLCFDSTLGIEPEPPKIVPRAPQQGDQLHGKRDPIQEFNQSYSVQSILITNGYMPVGSDRFIRPGSESKAPGAIIMRNCSDGIERVYSHGGDILNDDFAHDAFDCFRLLEHAGNWAKALDWNAEITRHNQRLYMAEQTSGQRKENTSFPLVPAPELTAKPVKIEWLLENILEQGSLNLLFGEPGAGKSLFALDWAFCIAAGLDWRYSKTKQTDVVIIAGEGFSGMTRRLKALEVKYEMTAPANLLISQCPADFLDKQNIKWLADSIEATCPNPGLVVIDTLHRNMNGDENSSQDIGKFISNIDRLLKPLGAAVLIVHHSGHGDKQRSRGSSSIRAAMDGEFSATKNGSDIILTCHKAKDFEAFKPIQFKLKPTNLGWLDENGAPLTSVYLEYKSEGLPVRNRRKLSTRDESILTSLGRAIAEYGVNPTTEIITEFGGFSDLLDGLKKVAHIEHWRNAVYPLLDADSPSAKQKAFKRARDKLFELGKVANWNDYWWISP